MKIIYNVLGSPVKGRGQGDDQIGCRRPVLREKTKNIVVTKVTSQRTQKYSEQTQSIVVNS